MYKMLRAVVGDAYAFDEYPDHVEETLAYGAAQCVAFNRRGTLMAVGCKTGQIVIWDFLTRSVGKVLMDRNHVVGAVTCHWSRDGYKLVVGYANGQIWRWDVLSGAVDARVTVPVTLPSTAASAANAATASGAVAGVTTVLGGAEFASRILSAQMHPKNPYVWLFVVVACGPGVR